MHRDMGQMSLLDATVDEAQVRRPPRTAGHGAQSPTALAADCTYRGRGIRLHFGYKMQLAWTGGCCWCAGRC